MLDKNKDMMLDKNKGGLPRRERPFSARLTPSPHPPTRPRGPRRTERGDWHGANKHVGDPGRSGGDGALDADADAGRVGGWGARGGLRGRGY